MSVRGTQARLATPGDEVIVLADAGQLVCLAAIDDADYIIQDEVVLKSGVTEAASLSFVLFKDCDSSEKLAAVLYGSRPNVVLVGEMTEYEKIQNATKRLLTDLPMLGRFVAILLEPVSDDDDKPSFLNWALALNSNLPFGCDNLKWQTGLSCTYTHMVDLMSRLRAAQGTRGTCHRPRRTSSCGL